MAKKKKNPVENPVDTGKWLGDRLRWVLEKSKYYGAGSADESQPGVFRGKLYTTHHPEERWPEAMKKEFRAQHRRDTQEYYDSIKRKSKEYDNTLKTSVFKKSARLQPPFDEDINEPSEDFFNYLVGTKGGSKYSLLKIIDGMIAAQKEAKHRDQVERLGKRVFVVEEEESRDKLERRKKKDPNVWLKRVLRKHKVVAATQDEALHKVGRREKIGVSRPGWRYQDHRDSSKRTLKSCPQPLPIELLAETKRHPKWVQDFSFQHRYSNNTVKILKTYKRMITSSKKGSLPKVPRSEGTAYASLFSAMKVVLDRKKSYGKSSAFLRHAEQWSERTASIDLVESLLNIFSDIGHGRGSSKIGGGFRQSEMSMNSIRLQVKPIEDYAFGYLNLLVKMPKVQSSRLKPARRALSASNPKKSAAPKEKYKVLARRALADAHKVLEANNINARQAKFFTWERAWILGFGKESGDIPALGYVLIPNPEPGSVPMWSYGIRIETPTFISGQASFITISKPDKDFPYKDYVIIPIRLRDNTKNHKAEVFIAKAYGMKPPSQPKKVAKKKMSGSPIGPALRMPSENPKKATKKKATRKKTPAYQLLINRCQKLWTHYCDRPSKKRLEALYIHLDKMKESTSKKVATERSRCLRAANAEAKKLKYKRKK